MTEITTAVTTGLTSAQGSTIALIATVIPFAIGIFVAKWVPLQGLRFFKQASK